MITKIKTHVLERTSEVLLKSDLLTTRTTIGLSSLLFSSILLCHYLREYHLDDLMWIVISLFHAVVTLGSLYTGKTNWFTFFGEAVCGFGLWTYIGLGTIIVFNANNNVDFMLGNFSPAMAPFAPTFIIVFATWWIIARYPKITKK